MHLPIQIANLWLYNVPGLQSCMERYLPSLVVAVSTRKFIRNRGYSCRTDDSSREFLLLPKAQDLSCGPHAETRDLYFPCHLYPSNRLFAIISFRGLYNSSKNFRRTRRLASSYRHFQYKMVMVGGCHAYESGDTVPFQVLRWCCMSDCGTSRILCGGCTCVTAYNCQSVNLGLVECASSMP